MRIAVKDWGNSKGLRLTREILDLLDWRGEDFEVGVVDGKLVAEKIDIQLGDYDPNNIMQFKVGEIYKRPYYIDMSEPSYCNVLVSGGDKIADNLIKQIENKKAGHKIIQLSCDNATEELENIINTLTARYNTFRKLGVNNIKKYDEHNLEQIERIFLVVDLDELDMSKEILDKFIRVLTGGRASGIHTIVRQSDYNRIISGTISANCPIKVSTGNLLDAMIVSSHDGIFVLD